MIELLSTLNMSKLVIKQAGAKTGLDELFDSINKVNKTKGAAVQVFDYESVADKMHLIGAYVNALSAFRDHTNTAKSISMEMLLFAAMTDQIGYAIDSIGAKKGSGLVVFANSRSAFNKIRSALYAIKEFRPSKPHASKVLRSLGIPNVKNAGALLLQKMAVSRLGT